MNRVCVVMWIVLLCVSTSVSMISAAAEPELKNLFGRLTSVSDMVEFKSLPNYQEAPSVAKMVAEGKLPPIEERLPQEPLIWKKAVMVDGIGEYGDVHRRTSGSKTMGWNVAAGQVQGWGGMSRFSQEILVHTAPIWMLKEPEPMPNLAKSWEWSSDGMTLTMHLVKGIKWSDGVEFTADDVLFTYHDNILDNQVPGFQSAGVWTFNEKVAELEKVDDYTIAWHFATAFPTRVFFNMSPVGFSIIPAHVYKQYHPKYNSAMTYDQYLVSTPPEDLPAVVLGAYVPVAYKTEQQAVYIRNPYYWKVDEEGNQLPYIDEIVFTKASSWAGRTLNVLAGSCDLSIVNDPDMYTLIIAATQNPNSHVGRWMGGYVKPLEIYFNLSLYAGATDDKATALRELFREKEFRVAVSHLVNRKGITEGLFPIPGAIQPYYGAFPSGSPMYDESKVVKYEYDVGKARELLGELGFVDPDGNGTLNWPQDSRVPGDELIIEIMTVSTEDERVKIAEALVPDFQKAGIELRVKNLQGGIYTSKYNTGDWEMLVQRDMSRVTPEAKPHAIGAISDSTPSWHLPGPDGKRELLAFEKEIMDLLVAAESMTSAAEQKKTFGEILRISTENAYSVGVYEMRWILVNAKRHRNIPADLPTFLYDWSEKSLPIEIRWTPKALQLSTQFQDLIPTPETYKAQEWYDPD